MPKVTTITYGGISWIDVFEPSPADIKKLAEKYDFHELDMEDCLTENQRPKIDEYDKYLFIVLHFPAVITRPNRRIRTAEIDIFIGAKFIITVHWGDLPVVTKIMDACERESNREKYLGRGTGYFLYELVSDLFDNCFPLVDDLWREVTHIEKEVFDEEETKDSVESIMTLKHNIIALRRILQPERPVISALEHKNKKFLPEALEVYFDDIVDKVEKLWTSLDSLKEVAETLQDANESFISHTTGNTIKVLTIFSVIAVPFTLFNNIFSMNLWFPGDLMHSPQAFYLIVGLMFVLSCTFLAYLKWRRWL